jgi:hypothetical protein
MFDQNARSADFIECWIINERRSRQIAGNRLFRKQNVGKSRWCHFNFGFAILDLRLKIHKSALHKNYQGKLFVKVL